MFSVEFYHLLCLNYFTCECTGVCVALVNPFCPMVYHSRSLFVPLPLVDSADDSPQLYLEV